MGKLKLTAVALVFLVGSSVAGCGSGGNTDAVRSSNATTGSPGGSATGSLAPADPLEGEWRQTITCVENVQTFQRNLANTKLWQRQELAKLKLNKDVSVPTLLREYTREFAWGPNALGPSHGELTPAQVEPESLCKGAPTRGRTMRFQQGSLVVEDSGGSWGVATYEIIGGDRFTADDGGVNFGTDSAHSTDTFSFRIDGNILTIKMIGQVDPWAGTFLEEAPWHRVR